MLTGTHRETTITERIEGLLQRIAMLRGWSPRTTSSYHADLADAQYFLTGKGSNLFDVTEAGLMEYLAHLRRRGLRDTTLRRRRSALSTWFGLLQSEGLRSDNPVR